MFKYSSASSRFILYSYFTRLSRDKRALRYVLMMRVSLSNWLCYCLTASLMALQTAERGVLQLRVVNVLSQWVSSLRERSLLQLLLFKCLQFEFGNSKVLITRWLMRSSYCCFLLIIKLLHKVNNKMTRAHSLSFSLSLLAAIVFYLLFFTVRFGCQWHFVSV